MEILNDNLPKLELDYPCIWTYKIITLSLSDTKKAIRDVISLKEHKLKPSNKSKSGKYISMNLEILVQNEDERSVIFEELKSHKLTKMVL